MKRPNWFVYITLGFLVKIFAFFKGQKIIRKTKIIGPAIALSNHTSFYDFIYTTAAMYPRRVSYLAADKMFYDPVLGVFLRLARAIPKPLFQSDPVGTLNAFRILRKNGIVSIFPEGQISAIGRSFLPAFSIAKFLKKAKVDVFTVKHHNAYFVNPPWSKKTFRGRIETTMDLMLTKEVIEIMTEQEIYDVVVDRLYYDAAAFNLERKLKYKLNDISNLENAIYQCPNCEYEGLVGMTNHLHCPNCNLDLVYDEYGRLGKYGVNELFENQEKNVQKSILENSDFILSSPVKLESYRNKKVVIVGEGTLSLTREEYRFFGLIDGVQKTLVFDPKIIPYLPSDIGRNIQIYEGYQIYQFVFEVKYLPTKFVHAGEYIYKLKNQN